MKKPLSALLLSILFLSAAFVSHGQVTANFTIADTAGCAPMVNTFTNTSVGATTYTWDLGNGSTSTLTNVSTSYIAPGTYTVTLTASNGVTTSIKRQTFNVYAVPVVHFSASDTTLCPGVPAVFTSTTVPGSPGPMTYSWTFGDGSSSTGSSPSYGYTSAGNYNVTLFVTNGKGCIGSLSKAPYIHVYSAPTASFSAVSTYICKSGTANFTNSSSGSGPLGYVWRFGDGGASTVPSPTHHYTTSGVYTVSLKVTDINGCIDSLVEPSFMTVGGLTASYAPVPFGCQNVPVNFTNTSTSHLLSGWDFGDGSTSVYESPMHTYTATGTYSVRLIIYDGTCFDTVIHPITITHASGSFTISPAHPCPPPTTLTFNATVSAGSTVTWHSLVFGPLGTGTTLSHAFPGLSLYNPATMMSDSAGFIDSVTMIVTDAHGCSDTVGKLDTAAYLKVTIQPKKVDSCTAVTANLSIYPQAVVYDPFTQYPFWRFGYGYPLPGEVIYPYPRPITGYSWNFGDGSPLSTAPTPSHVYTLVGGMYDVSVHVTSTDGCPGFDSSHYLVKVGSPPPMPTVTVTPTSVCAGKPVHFSATATGVWDLGEWSYGDSGGDTGLTVTHVYTVPGTYTGYFYAVYNGCKSPGAVFHDTVKAPNANFSDSFNCLPRNKVTFRDLSIGDDTHLWQFGDGTTSTVSGVVHTFPAVGTYTVTLTTYNIVSGCRDTLARTIKTQPLNATLTPFPAKVCRDQPDSFSAAVLEMPGDSSIVTRYRWFYSGVLTDSFVSTYSFDTSWHSYHSTGLNIPMVVLTDNHGCFDTVTSSVIVAKPVDSFVFTPTAGCAILNVNFTDYSIPTAGTHLMSYYWSFGDGITGTTSTPTTSHSYSLDGTYTVMGIVTDSVGCKDTTISPTIVTVHKPVASFAAVVPTICLHNTVSFINTSIGYTTCLWFFGDGDTLTAVAPTHLYTAPGIYTVKLVATGVLGCTDTMTIPNYIVVNPVPHASFTMPDSFAVCAPFSVSFTNGSTGASIYIWDFGDGNTSMAVNPTDVYLGAGYYTVKLAAFNSYACSDTAIRHVTIFGYSGAFTYSPSGGCPPLPVHFLGSFASVATVVWDFADGVTSSLTTADTISHTYLSPGLYLPKLILTDSLGCTASSVGSDTIKVGNLVAGFTINPDPVCAGNLITFHDTSSGSISPIISHVWTFAPGSTASGATVTHTYTLAGVYTVTLTVTNAVGCTGTVTQTVTVVSLPPPIVGPSIVCIGSVTPFTDSIMGGIWSSTSPHVIVGSTSGFVTGVSVGPAILTYSIGTGGCTVTKPVTVIAGPSAISGTTNVCPASTIALTDPTPGGTWSSSSTAIALVGSSTGVVTGVASGVDTIYYTVGSCYAFKVITVNPFAAPIIGSPHICIGTATTLTSAPPGGTWTSSNTLVATIGSSSGLVSGLLPGTSIITYIPPVGCRGTLTVTVNLPPTAITGRTFVCPGGTAALSDTVSGGVWTSSDTTIATIGFTSGIATGVALGVVTITYNIGGCTTTRALSVDPFPAGITGPPMVCQGASITLSDITAGGLWTSSAPFVASVGSTTGVVTGIALGAVTISYSLGGGCTATAPVSIDPVPAGITGSHFLCPGSTTHLSDITTGGVWSSTDLAVATVGSTGTVSGIVGGLDTILYTTPNTCSALFQVSVVTVPAITGLTNLCAWGDTLTIHDADSTGSYSSSLVTVTNLGSGLGRVLANAPGIATITYTIPLGCNTAATITINPLPAAISGTLNICLGASTTLHNSVPGGYWSTTSSLITLGTSSGAVTGIAAGTAHVTYTLATTGCKVDTAVHIFTSPLVDSIMGPAYLCAGQTIALIDSTPGGAWASSSAHATVLGGTVSGVSAGTAIISYTVTNPCGSVSASKSITVYPAVTGGTITGSDSVCVSSSISLVDTVSGGVWSNTGTSVSIAGAGLVTGLLQGVDTVIYTVSNPSCTASTKRPVFVKPLPFAGTLTGNTALCIGDSATVTASVTGGVWHESSTIGGIRHLAGAVRVYTYAAGVDTIYYTVTNSCGSDNATLVLNVGAPPFVGPIDGASLLCEQQNITLADSITGGHWSSGSPGVATVGLTSGVVSGVRQGKDTITYVVTNACGTVSVSKPLTVNPLPVAGSIYGASSMCVGDSVVLGDSVAGGVWSVTDSAATIKGDVIVSGVSAGNSIVSYTVTNSCASATVTQQITVEPLPTAITITGNGHVLSVPKGYATYQWLLNGQPIPGATTNTYTYPSDGIGLYTVEVDNALGCSYTSPRFIVADCAVSEIRVYPNPASATIYLEWCKLLNARLTTIDGKMLQYVENATQLDISYLPNAVYTLTLYDATGQKLLTKRITKLSK